MKKTIYLSFLLFSHFIIIAAQEDKPDRVPKQYSIETGYLSLLKTDFENISHNGIQIGFDYAWQLTGLAGKKPPVYISVPIAYTCFWNSQPEDSAMSMLTYGWTVRHHITKSRKVTPYLGYSLLLNQLKIFHKVGATMGHQTKFEFGLNFNSSKTIPYIQVEYSLNRFPFFDRKSKWIYSAGIKGGVRF